MATEGDGVEKLPAQCCVTRLTSLPEVQEQSCRSILPKGLHLVRLLSDEEACQAGCALFGLYDFIKRGSWA